MIQIKNEQGFVIVFVLLILLLSGIASASLLHNSLIGNKIINNYIVETKTNITGRAGILVLNEIIEQDFSVSQLLDLSYGKEYTIMINMVNKEADQDKENREYEVIGSYKNNDKILYYKPQSHEQ